MIENDRQPWVKGLPALGIIWLVGAVGDRLWFALDRTMPAWDQAEYLTGALNYWRALQTPQWFSGDWWITLWQLSSKIPPLVYISTAPFLNLLGTGPDQSTTVNLLFSAVLLGSVYGLGVTLFTVQVGLWAAGLCLLMPGLYQVRLDYLMDYPLTALVTLSLACLTFWKGIGDKGQGTGNRGEEAIGEKGAEGSAQAIEIGSRRGLPWLTGWLLAIAVGISVGLAFMVKQSALLFLLVPLGWTAIVLLWQRTWGQLGQLFLAIGVSTLILYPWYRTNWLLMLTAGKRATVDSAIAEGDPSLLSLDAWTFYLKQLPAMVSLPLLLVPIAGFLLFWRRSRVSSYWEGEADYAPKSRGYRQQIYLASRRSLAWLLVILLGGYLLSSLNINKDPRYGVPYLPIVAILLAYGLVLLPRAWRLVRWGTIGLASVMMLFNLLPLPGAAQAPTTTGHRAYLGAEFPHDQVVAEVIRTEPFLRSTIGVLPSTPTVNQHNINYYGLLKNFQVYGRQVGTRLKHVPQDARSLDWFMTKSGEPGSIRKPDAYRTIVEQVERGTDFQLQKTWTLPDSSQVMLYHRRVPSVEVTQMEVTPANSDQNKNPKRSESRVQNPELKRSAAPIRLEQVTVPIQVPPGKPVPVTYRWSGSWKSLQSGLVLLTWQKLGRASSQTERWLHDHAIGMGALNSTAPQAETAPFQVVERTAMLPPADVAAGTYRLEAIYLNRQTGETATIVLPPVTVQVNPVATASPAPELDLVTQLRTLATALPQGTKALDSVFDEVGRINQYDPTQDYVNQTRQAMEYRLQQEPDNRGFAYTVAIANVLKRRVEPAIASLERVVQLDSKNPFAYAYLAFVNLYDFRPAAAQTALNTAISLDPNIPELQVLSGVASLMRGNLIQAWRHVRAYQLSELQDNAAPK